MKLISMTDFVLERSNKNISDGAKITNQIFNYANFLKQPLKLEMFIPCDYNLNILEEPIFHEPNNENEIGNYEKLIEEYYEAKDKVLFEGFEVIHTDKVRITIAFDYFQIDFNIINNSFAYENIEELTRLKYNLTLTPNAIKQFQLYNH